MPFSRIALAALACSALFAPGLAAAQGFPKLPRVPKVPSVKLPSGGGEAARTQRNSNQQPAVMQRSGGNDTNAYMQDVMKLTTTIDSNWDGERIDREVGEIRSAAERIAANGYAGVPPQMQQSNQMQMKQAFDRTAGRVDHEIDWAATRMARNAGSNPNMPTLIYNEMLALETALYAATTIFPDNATYRAAHRKVGAELARYGSREGAGNALEQAALAKAASVSMPAATNNDPALVAMFRTAWGTSGIDWEILKINPRGGWGVKRDSVGRIIGRTHDAAIAARNPRDPDHCNLYDFTLLKLEGGGVRRSSHSTTRIACENVK